uniref:Uncharacterized protein n=1 Tax=Ditylenchus dipsaci TaxID=166011 RepID=A0A915DVI6_9BILA
MDMELFRHNHARFIAVDAVYPLFLQENMAIFNFSDFKESVKNSWFKQNPGSKNFKMSEAAFIFDAIYLAAHSVLNFSQLYPIEPSSGVHHTTVKCRSTTHSQVPYGYGRKLINHIRNTTLIGLTGDLARINLQPIQHPANHNFSFRINLLGYTGRIDDIGYWEPVTDVVTTIMERPYVMLKKNHFEMDKNSQFEAFALICWKSCPTTWVLPTPSM